MSLRQRIHIRIPKTGIRLQFWARSRRTIWPRVPLTELSDLPAHLVAGVLVKKAPEAPIEGDSRVGCH